MVWYCGNFFNKKVLLIFWIYMLKYMWMKLYDDWICFKIIWARGGGGEEKKRVGL